MLWNLLYKHDITMQCFPVTVLYLQQWKKFPVSLIITSCFWQLSDFSHCLTFGDSSEWIANQTSGFVSFFRNIITSPEYGQDIQSIVNASDYSDSNFLWLGFFFSPLLWNHCSVCPVYILHSACFLKSPTDLKKRKKPQVILCFQNFTRYSQLLTPTGDICSHPVNS